ncbi:MAG: DUF1559 domain-containing protein [Planctomycetaceae bacterium]|nr:DUF1559 domain-containing protein [Planctomycetaceae bacterium]
MGNQEAREAARRTQCTNRLKQIGLAVHLFHDSQNALPPYAVAGSARSLLWGLLYPYMEQQALYDTLQEPYSYLGGFVTINDWWNSKLDTNHRKAFGSFSGYQCPTRRSGYYANEFATNNNDINDRMDAAGPQGDYAFVCSNRTGNWWYFENDASGTLTTTLNCISGARGPFRPAFYTLAGTAGQQLTWTPRDTFAWCSDGLSNQFFIGEKHIPLGRLGQCPNNVYASSNAVRTRTMGECSYLRGYASRTTSAARTLASYEAFTATGLTANIIGEYPICRPSDYESDTEPPAGPYHSAYRALGFGSWHPGICNFLLGDVAVRGVAVTTTTKILRVYSFVDDGEVVSLP